MNLSRHIEHDLGFLDRIAAARASIQAGNGMKIEDLEAALKKPAKRKRCSSPPARRSAP